MGSEREQPSGEVLHLDRRRASPPTGRNRRLEPASVRDCRGLEYDLGGGVNMFKRFRSLLRVLTRRRDFEDGMTEELRFHIEQYADDLVRSGMSTDKAARHARMEFGSLDSVKGDCREERGLHLFDEFRRELSYAVRLLRKTPGFTVTALLPLAVCPGANLTIFAVIDSVLLRPLPFPEPDRLMTIFNTYPKAGVGRDGSSLTNYYERRGHISAFTSLAIYR